MIELLINIDGYFKKGGNQFYVKLTDENTVKLIETRDLHENEPKNEKKQILGNEIKLNSIPSKVFDFFSITADKNNKLKITLKSIWKKDGKVYGLDTGGKTYLLDKDINGFFSNIDFYNIVTGAKNFENQFFTFPKGRTVTSSLIKEEKTTVPKEILNTK